MQEVYLMFVEIIEALVYTFVQTNWMVLNPEKEAIKEIIFYWS